ncbi:hypothetical protein LTR78_007989, partial [Recurvomyces mirabilis]
MSDVEAGHEAHRRASEAEDEEEEDDLFKNAFGDMKESPEEEDDDDDDSDISEITAVTPANPDKLKINGKSAQQILDLDNEAEHTPNCHPHRKTSTPPTSPKPTQPTTTPTTSLLPTGPKEANLQKDLRPALRRHHRIHLHTLTFAPRHPRPLPQTRYLISVLHASRKQTLSTSTSSSGSNQEKHHIWMLGNRLTTIST